MTPRYLADQLERSRRNLGVQCIDVFYLHNPETQLGEISKEEFQRRIREAFEFLESAVGCQGKSAPMGWPRGMPSARTPSRPAIFRSKKWLGSQPKPEAATTISDSCNCL